MSRRSTDHAATGPDWWDDLVKAPDYSPAFGNRVATLALRISTKLGTPVEFKPDLNERVSEIIAAWFDETGGALPPCDYRARWRLHTHISAKGPYFAFVVLKLTDPGGNWQKIGLARPGSYWAPARERDVPSAVQSAAKKIALILKGEGYRRLREPDLTKEVKDCETDTGDPATVFDLLFGEGGII